MKGQPALGVPSSGIDIGFLVGNEADEDEFLNLPDVAYNSMMHN